MESIFEKIKQISEYDGNEGKFELNYLYIYDKMPIDKQFELADCLIEQLIGIYNKTLIQLELEIQNISLICYFNPFMGKLNTLVKEGIIDEKWIKRLTNNFIYKGEKPAEVQMGLILAEEYLEKNKLDEIVEVFSKSGKYIFYLMNTIKKLHNYNTYLLNLAQKTSGTIKVFAITNMEVLNDKIGSYLIEEGYKDEQYEYLLINYIISIGTLKRYLDNEDIDKIKINNLSYLICEYLRGTDFNELDIDIKYQLVNKYLPLVIEKGDNFTSLYSLFLIKEGIWSDYQIECNRQELEYNIRNILQEEKWRNIFI